MDIVNKKVTELIPYVNNARTHSDKQILQIYASIKEFGFTNPVLTDGKNGIIAGHGRLMAAIKLGIDEVPTIELSHLTKAQKKAYILADNKIALNSGWDDDLLAIEFDELKDLDFDISLTGFDEIEIGEIIGISDNDNVEKYEICGLEDFNGKILIECSNNDIVFLQDDIQDILKKYYGSKLTVVKDE